MTERSFHSAWELYDVMGTEFADVENTIKIESERARRTQPAGKSCFRSPGCESEDRATAQVGHIKIVCAIQGHAAGLEQSRSEGTHRAIGRKLNNGAVARRVISGLAQIQIAV